MFHRPFYLIVLMLMLSALAAGCGGQSAQEVGDLPTIVEFPTDAPTNTPEPITPTTEVPTVTATNTPTATLTPSLTITLTPSKTFTPSNTAPPRPTATFTLTLSFTPAPASATPTLAPVSPTSDTPQILSFQASSSVAAAGGTVQLTWEAVGDVARIDRLSQLGQVVQTFSVTPSGQLPVTIPANEGSTITYRLAVSRGSQEVTSTLTITVSGGAVNCPINWFFGNEFAPLNAGCPLAAATLVNAAYQPFQTGRMLYLQSTNSIYTMIDAGGALSGTLTRNDNTWDGTSTFTCADPVPGGLFAPQKMFGAIYCNTMAPNGVWNSVLGYALTNIDESQRTVQTDSAGAIYVDVPGGSVYRLEPVPAGQLSATWTKIK